MTQISKKFVSKDIFYELFDNFDYLIVSLKSKEEVFNCFKDLLTKHEKIILAKRIAILLLLTKGLTFLEIRQAIRVSTNTVSRYKKLLDDNSESYKIIIKKMEEFESTRKFYEKLHQIFGFVELMLTARSDMRSRAKLMSGNY